MSLDLFTASLMAALVANVCGAIYIIDTLLRRDDGPGRVWAIAFLCGMATTIAYMMWAAGTGGFVAISLGNALFVATTAVMWLGARRFNERSLRAALVVAVVGIVIVAASAAIEGPEGGDWAGWLAMALSVTAFSVLAGIECFRPPLVRFGTSAVLGGVFLIVAVAYLARSVVFLIAGPDSEIFLTWFGSVMASYLTVVLSIVAVVVTSMLRGTQSDLRAYAWMSAVGVTSDGLMLSGTFESALRDVVERAQWRGELVALISVRLEDLRQIRISFGADVAGDVVYAFRQGVRRYAASISVVGEDGDVGLLVVTRASTAADARRQAGGIYRGLLESLGAVTQAVIPVVGVGVALTETVGYDADALLVSARAAGASAASSVETSVVFGGTAPIRDALS